MAIFDAPEWEPYDGVPLRERGFAPGTQGLAVFELGVAVQSDETISITLPLHNGRYPQTARIVLASFRTPDHDDASMGEVPSL